MTQQSYRWVYILAKTVIQKDTRTPVFTAALFTITTTMQPKCPKCPSTREWIKKMWYRTSLVGQWMNICLPKQETWVRSLIWEDSTGLRATKPSGHKYWACTLQLLKLGGLRAYVPITEPTCLKPVLHNERSPCTATKSSPHSPQIEKGWTQQRWPSTAANK